MDPIDQFEQELAANLRGKEVGRPDFYRRKLFVDSEVPRTVFKLLLDAGFAVSTLPTTGSGKNSRDEILVAARKAGGVLVTHSSIWTPSAGFDTGLSPGIAIMPNHNNLRLVNAALEHFQDDESFYHKACSWLCRVDQYLKNGNFISHRLSRENGKTKIIRTTSQYCAL